MKPTDFSKYLTDFLTRYLPGERGVSQNTILSYRDTFLLFITFMKSHKGIDASRLDFNIISKKNVIEFLDWLQNERRCCDSTRNARLAALHAFFHYLHYQYPMHLYEWQQILSIPIKKTQTPIVNYLSLDAIKTLLQEPDLSDKRGRRDLALLSLMYDSGARVQEMIDLTPAMVRLDLPFTVKLIGKGNKARIVPLIEAQVCFLRQYIIENKLHEPYANQYPLFSNNRKQKLTRAGVTHILMKYVNQVRKKDTKLVPARVSCHTFRHSKAMHLLQAGVNLIYIRDILGHNSVKTTETYARADSQKKREAIEKAYSEVKPTGIPAWLVNQNLLGWLKEFGK
jgi:integrase/recombinase XerD